MKDFQLINHIRTPVAVIDKDMNIIEANEAYKRRNKTKNIIGAKCFNVAYHFDEPCSNKSSCTCPVQESFETKKNASVTQNFWIHDHAVVEEVITTPIIEENGEVNYVIEEFRDITKLLGLNKGIMNVCSYCRKIRCADKQWLTFETYLQKHTGANFSHGICKECKTDIINKTSKKVKDSANQN